MKKMETSLLERQTVILTVKKVMNDLEVTLIFCMVLNVSLLAVMTVF
jgi:hypothetical protein